MFYKLSLPEVLAGLGQEGLEVDMRVSLFEAEELEQPLLGQLLLPDLLEDLHQRLVVALGELMHLLLLRCGDRAVAGDVIVGGVGVGVGACGSWIRPRQLLALVVVSGCVRCRRCFWPPPCRTPGTPPPPRTRPGDPHPPPRIRSSLFPTALPAASVLCSFVFVCLFPVSVAETVCPGRGTLFGSSDSSQSSIG